MITQITNNNYTTQEKLQILADAAKYDVACTSSGSSRRGKKGELGNAEACGICHSFASDGRCISLLKILFTNHTPFLNASFFEHIFCHYSHMCYCSRMPSNGILPMLRIPNQQNLQTELYPNLANLRL